MDSSITFLCSISSLHKAIGSQFCNKLSHKHNKFLQKIQTLILVILLSLLSLYFMTSNSVDLIRVLAFFVVVVASLTLALPYSRTVLDRSKSIPIHVTVEKTVQKSTGPIVWSIGSDFKCEKRENDGVWVKNFSNGDVYEGGFDRGKCSGSGVYRYNLMCGKYEGEWIDGKYDGYGVETWSRGSIYKGQYRNGLRHGVGVYKFYVGDVYEGVWFNGHCHGCGVHSSNDGSKYVGEFKWGVKHGFGHYHYRNGDVYAGEYFADRMHGFGVYKFVNGHRYEGSWHEGRRHGYGVYTFRNGEVKSGYWQNGLLDKASSQEEPFGSSVAGHSRKVSDVVEKARQASETAYNVTTVYDRVGKVIAAANRVATAARVSAVKAVQKRKHEGTYSKVLAPNA